jgi:hypothetical protein
LQSLDLGSLRRSCLVIVLSAANFVVSNLDIRLLATHSEIGVFPSCSVDFSLVPLPWFVLVLLVLLVFGFAVVRLVSDERAFSISRAGGSFGRRLYIRRLCT